MMKMKKNRDFSSFRDPSGYIYYQDGVVMRYIYPCYFKQYDHLMRSGLYQELVEKGLLIPHEEVERDSNHILLKVQKIPFISYSYEWVFEQLKDAALLTLSVLQISLKYGMILKDCSSYNVQFLKGKAIFIDTLSFDFYQENMPWLSYGQFSRHFLAPLILMKYVDYRLNSLMKNYIDGIPLDLCSHLLGRRGGFIGYSHIKLQNKSIQNHQMDGREEVPQVHISKKSLFQMIQMVERQIKRLSLKDFSSEWDDYYQNSNYFDAMNEKKRIISEMCQKISISDDSLSFDLGGNDGRFSSLIYHIFHNHVVSFDIDSNAVSRNYLQNKEKQTSILPLVMDFTNPSSGIGFANCERMSFMERGGASLTLVLAFLHHLVISNNLSFEMVSHFLSSITHYLIIEFVPKEDSQVQLLLKTREDIFNNYDIQHFKDVFSNDFNILEEVLIPNTKRTLFLMEVLK